MSERAGRPGPGGRGSRFAWIAVLAAVTAAIAIAIPLAATSTPGFFARYHLLQRRYVNLEGSAHEGIGCRTCHETAPVANAAALVADFYVSLVRREQVPRFFRFRPPTRQACIACHEQDWSWSAARTKRIPHPAHGRVATEKRDCVRCHKWTAHFESYMPKHKEMPFSGVCVAYGCHVGTKPTDKCLDCHHVLHEDGPKWRIEHPKTVKADGENVCLESCHKVVQCQECHTTGRRPKFTGMTVEIGMRAIETLHVRKDWTARFHGTEALRGEQRCMRCHLSQGECGECHRLRPAFHGGTDTWIGRHVKATKKVDDPRCLACHRRPWCEDCHKRFKEMG